MTKKIRIMLAAVLTLGCAVTQGAVVNPENDGTVSLPYFEDFETEDHLDLLYVIDANNDGRSWYYSDIVFDIRNRASEERDADDWLLLPPMRLEADKSYRLEFVARAVYNEYMERLEVKLGAGAEPDASAMTIPLIPPTDIQQRGTMGVTITVPETGIYRIGFHAISPKGAFRLALDNISVESPKSALRPGIPTGCWAEGTAPGELKAHVAFHVPDKTVNGKALSDIDRITLWVNGENLFEEESPVPGRLIETTVDTRQGINTFRVAASNAEGEGEPVEFTLFTGDDTPMPPTDVRMEVRDGKAYLTWTAPTEGENGGFIDPAMLTYEIQRRSDFSYVESSFAGTEYVDVLPDNINSRPRQLFYCVRAISAGGKSLDSGDSNRFITGDAVTVPFRESFANANYDDDHWWHSINDGERWNLTGSLVYDNDGGAAKFAPANMGENSLFYTSRIDLRDTTNPLVTFYYWHVKNSDMRLELQVSRENGEFKTLRTFDFSDNQDVTGWKKAAVLLRDYTDAEYVLVGWKATAGGIQTVTAFDAVEICDVASADLSVAVSAPSAAAENQPVMLEATVANVGATDARGFKVRLTHESLGLIEEREFPLLEVGMEKVVEFNFPFQPTPGFRNGAYVVSVEWNEDINYSNDSQRVVIEVRPGRLPKPETLSGVRSDNDVVLSWKEPSLSGPVTDDMEDYEPFLISDFGEWITIDRDRQLTYRIVEAQLDETGEQISYVTLEYPNAGMPMAFQVFNPTEAGSSYPEGMCRSGNQVLASFAAVKEHNDDWLISPELSGEAQTVSFWARSGGDEMWGQEKIEVYCSERLQTPENFTQLLGVTSIPNGEWKEITVDVPEGARHFAIRCVSEIVMSLFVDDITYTPKPADAHLVGYNIYRDNVCLNTVPVNDRTYADFDVPENAVYTVRAVYEEGESLSSNPVALAEMEQGAVGDVAEGRFLIRTCPGIIEVKSASSTFVSVYDLTGIAVGSGDCTETQTFSVSPGIYIVRIGEKSIKVAVP